MHLVPLYMSSPYLYCKDMGLGPSDFWRRGEKDPSLSKQEGCSTHWSSTFWWLQSSSSTLSHTILKALGKCAMVVTGNNPELEDDLLLWPTRQKSLHLPKQATFLSLLVFCPCFTNIVQQPTSCAPEYCLTPLRTSLTRGSNWHCRSSTRNRRQMMLIRVGGLHQSRTRFTKMTPSECIVCVVCIQVV